MPEASTNTPSNGANHNNDKHTRAVLIRVEDEHEGSKDMHHPVGDRRVEKLYTGETAT